MSELPTLLVTDLKQWGYCPRIVYYRCLFGQPGHPTFKMEEGKLAQETLERLELRRSLKRYGFETAKRWFGVWLHDAELGLAGRLDMVLEAPKCAAVVDFKLTGGPPRDNHLLQLGGYALLAERRLGLPVRAGFIYRIPDGAVFAIELDDALRERVCRAMAAIRETVQRQWCPEATSVRQRCVDCEYANYCGDVW